MHKQQHLINKRDVGIYQFGTFKVQTSKARMGRNPSTGAELEIPAKDRVKFKVSSTLKEMVETGQKKSKSKKK